jgi:hypothetical protein
MNLYRHSTSANFFLLAKREVYVMPSPYQRFLTYMDIVPRWTTLRSSYIIK